MIFYDLKIGAIHSAWPQRMAAHGALTFVDTGIATMNVAHVTKNSS
jgi:hypothetical protein